ncbi:TMEM198/TM7SF3 family protein [Clostridium sp. CM028]|uniref:TMEM198/TM7SF3 family protein n=1 Tax=unclassified Clostridium TaxID=2614128 RepID=UPI001C0DAD7E|nr:MULTISPECIES: TMEM198/TM7SF3 family protein [unclassified Clostridium]MBU3091917.1 TMEM198/TM7SF3 family protein [Clostridium sp. CF011]MBW9147766.1 TMEM198/TM7SF3 family protein [Clostridium sp. CM028]WAG70433.1 TMEM198/TM7SF3 family protein [Clostridium sp. CF011]WLC62087.1 TMEM198/TM7SF3 family protein [Clostridium sp. CM028]
MIEILDQFSSTSGQSIKLIAITLFIFGILQCFLGYKILKFWIAVFGFLIFGMLGGLVSVFIIGSLGAGIFFGLLFAIGGAFISLKIYNVGVFTLCGLMGFLLAYMLTQSIALSIFTSLVVGILSIFFVKTVIILSTSVSGGFAAGMSLLIILKADSDLANILLSVAISIVGVLVQLTLHKNATNSNSCFSKINSSQPKSLPLGNTFSSNIKNIIEMDNSLVAKEATGVTFDEVCQNLLEVLYSFKVLKTIMPFIDFILYFVSFISIAISIFTDFIWINSSVTILLLVGALCFINKKYIALSLSFVVITISKLIMLASSLPKIQHSKYSTPYELIDTAIIGYIAFESIKHLLKSDEGILLKNKLQNLFQKRNHTNHNTNTSPQSANGIKIMIRCPNCTALNSETSEICNSCESVLIVNDTAVNDAETQDINV